MRSPEESELKFRSLSDYGFSPTRLANYIFAPQAVGRILEEIAIVRLGPKKYIELFESGEEEPNLETLAEFAQKHVATVDFVKIVRSQTFEPSHHLSLNFRLANGESAEVDIALEEFKTVAQS